MNVQVVLYVVRKGRSQKDQEYVMHRKIGTPAVALVLFAAFGAVSFAQTSIAEG
jgi:hypothetical protein